MPIILLRHDRDPKPVTDGDRMVYEIAAAIDECEARREMQRRDYHSLRELPWVR